MPEQTESPDIKQQVLDKMSEGSTLTEVCQILSLSRAEVWRWRQADPAFDKAYESARRAMADAIADDSLTLVKRLANDPDATKEQVQSAHNYSQRAAWYASKMLRKVYGDEPNKTEINIDKSQVLVCTEEQRRKLIELRQKLLPDKPLTQTEGADQIWE